MTPSDLAKLAVETYLREGVIITPPLEPVFLSKAGVFVTIERDNGLRGCIGTYSSQYKNIGEEIIFNAIYSATKDYRFEEVSIEELQFLKYAVSILNPLEKVSNKSDLNPKKYGIVVKSKEKIGVLLPEVVESIDEQIRIACQKAGIKSGNFEIFRFTVTKYKT